MTGQVITEYKWHEAVATPGLSSFRFPWSRPISSLVGSMNSSKNFGPIYLSGHLRRFHPKLFDWASKIFSHLPFLDVWTTSMWYNPDDNSRNHFTGNESGSPCHIAPTTPLISILQNVYMHKHGMCRLPQAILSLRRIFRFPHFYR